MLLTNSLQYDLIIIFILVLYIWYKYMSKCHQYWSKKGVYTPKSLPIIGHFLNVALLKITLAEWLKEYYDSINEKYFGLYVFDEPFLVVKDPEIIKMILIKDFSYFSDRNVAAPKHDETQQNIMFFQKNPGWRTTRTKLTPTFTSGKLKGMFHLIDSCGAELNNWVDNNIGVHETKELIAKFSTNVIAKCAFGIDPECFLHEKADFREVGRKFFDFRLRNAFSQNIYFIKPTWVDALRLDFIEKKCLNYFSDVFLTTMRERPDNEKYNDLVDILKDLKKDKDNKFDDERLAGIAIQLFLGGFETTSSTIAFTLYEFCVNPEIQTKAREEVKNVLKKYGGKVTYDAIKDCEYLELCFNETIRKYPVVPFLDRKCNQDYRVPGSNLVIEKGTAIFIPLYGLQMDEKYFPDPYRYDPERMVKKSEAFMPFGQGPRICFGERFGRLSSKLALIYILKDFEVEKCEATPDPPVVFEPKSFMFASKTGLTMRFKKVK